jgi:predicted PurR-regulated permease PerM
VNARQLLTRSYIFTIVFFAIFLFLLYQVVRILTPFSAAILWAAIIALALHPLYRRVLALMRGNAGLAAGLMTLITLLIIIGPAITLLGLLTEQAVGLYQWAVEGVKSGAAIELWNRWSSAVSSKLLTIPFVANLDLKGILIKSLENISSNLASQVGTFLRNTLLLILQVFIMLFTLFFFFRNGERYYETGVDLIPFSKEQKKSIAKKLHDTFTAVINGVFLIALGQGIMTGIGFAVFGVPFPVFWGFLAAVLAILPVGGAALIWIPGAVYLFLSERSLSAILLTVWGVALVSLPDNFIKPLLIGKKAKLPVFFLFLGILGGLQVYGFLGILFGPLVVTLLTAFIQIYKEEFAGTNNTLP